MVDKRIPNAIPVIALLIFVLAGCTHGESLPTVTPPSLATMVRQQPRHISAVAQSATATVVTPVSKSATAIPATPLPDAVVRQAATSLYALPAAGGNVIEVLDEGAPLTVIGRMEGDQWLQVLAPGAAVGWVSSEALDVSINLEAVSVTAFVGQVQPTPAPTGRASGQIITGITRRSREIFERGQQLGNRANVFSKVGDSLTVASYVLFPIGWETHHLRDYAYLEPVVSYFSTEQARTANSFANTSLAADNGWTTQSVLNPVLANPDACSAGETPLACEYRTTIPAMALILLGTNDVAEIQPAAYRENMRRIISMSIDRGIIPVVSTIPDRLGFENQVVQFNAIIRDLAREFEIPLWDYGWAMQRLPNNGLSTDGVHPSWPFGDVSAAADFTGWNLQYGYTMRNLTALQVLDALWRQVIRG